MASRDLKQAVSGAARGEAAANAEVRASFPREWLAVTPAKARALQYLVENGPTQFWPREVLRSVKLIQRLKMVGYVEYLNRLSPGLIVYNITAEGREALRLADAGHADRQPNPREAK